MLAAARL
jgi:hypothetical protein